uniref:Actin-binding Rho-activating protein (inferred by orthology to a human protein) n=1 Tax=Strongyloides venezuelensis TaxID=75913 RepID=A0A0K0G197_STRVS
MMSKRSANMKSYINKFNEDEVKQEEAMSTQTPNGCYWPFKYMTSNTDKLKSKFDDTSNSETTQVDKNDPSVRNNRPYCRTSSTQKFIDKFNAVAKQTEEELKHNPFSNTYEIKEIDKKASDYARPEKGSKTEIRAKRAGNYITSEIIFLCEVINSFATGEVPNRVVKFGPLFYNYNLYSGSLVGMLIRARKYGLIDFEGEMLYQGQDNNKEIRMLKTIDDIKKCVRYSGDPVNCIAIVDT